MESQRFPITNDTSMNNKSKKKKQSSSSPEDSSKRSGSGSSTRKGQKPTPKITSPVNADGSPLFIEDSSIGNEYRTLRRKYLILEEESSGLGRELQEVEDQVKALEDEKASLLDELVVLEGLVDPSDVGRGLT